MMPDMGNHTQYVNGRRGEDGAIAAAPVIVPLELSHVWPPKAPPAVHPEAPVRVRFDGDRLRRGSMWLLASGVAAIAAIVSYSHIYDLGRAHGGTGTAARLLPLSVDMLILVGELM